MTNHDMLMLNPEDPPGSLFAVGGLYHKLKDNQRKEQMRSLDRDTIDSAKIRQKSVQSRRSAITSPPKKRVDKSPKIKAALKLKVKRLSEEER